MDRNPDLLWTQDSKVTRLDTEKGKTKQKDEENETQQKTAESVQPAGA